MSSQFIVIEKAGGWAVAYIVQDGNGNNEVFTKSEAAYEEADQCKDGIVVGDLDDSTERVYTRKQILEFRNKLQSGFDPNGNLVAAFDKHFDIT